MTELERFAIKDWVHSLGIDMPNRENTMDDKDFDELAGRLEAISRAVLHVAAALEQSNLIDGSQLAQSWRESIPEGKADTELKLAARKSLQELAGALDDARRFRQSRWLPD